MGSTASLFEYGVALTAVLQSRLSRFLPNRVHELFIAQCSSVDYAPDRHPHGSGVY